jgi:type IV pilus assembly protein PilF
MFILNKVIMKLIHGLIALLSSFIHARTYNSRAYGARVTLAALTLVLSSCSTDPISQGMDVERARAAPNIGFDKPGNVEEPETRRRAKIRLELAVNYFQSNQGKIALDEVNNALSADSEFPDAHVLKALILMDAKQNQAADESFSHALRLAPNDADANNTYGWFLCQTGRVNQSFAFFEKASSIPFYATPIKPLLNAGICSAKQNSYSQAESYYLRAQALDANSTTLHYHLALLYLKMNDSARAMAYTRKVLANSKPNSETIWLAIRVARKANDSVALAQMVQLLRDDFITSPQWALYTQEKFEEN